ncbi:hypothetical protein NKDENANG_03439 [Candidatus Entotheonellaceae bacterium PAL068K]
MAETTWYLRGDYFENCNCTVLCPCIHTPMAEPTEGHCDVGLAFHIDEGRCNDTSLDGLNFLIIAWTPTVMAHGNWKTGVYIDERAQPPQRDALGQILSGAMGGPMARFMGLTEHFLGIRYVPITYTMEGKTRRVTIPDIIDFNVEGVQARGHEEVMTLTNTAHPVSASLALARGTGNTYTDHDMQWDNTGRNAHYASFAWQWPA